MIGLFDSRRKIISFALTVLTVAVAVFVVSYQVVIKFAYAADNVYYGRSQAAVAKEINAELRKRPGCQPVTFQTSDNLTLHGFLFARPNAIGNILICHGYKNAKEFMYGFLDIFSNFNVLIFDFRANGESDGLYTSLGYHEYKDVVAAAKLLQTRTSRKLPFVILGFSMGGAATIRAAALHPGLANAYIIDSSFSELQSMFLRGYSLRTGLPYYPFFPVIRALFHFVSNCNIDDVNSASAVRMINEPILFIHSCDDTFVTPDHGIKLYANAQNEYSSIWIGPKARHGYLHSYYKTLYHHKVRNFLKESINFHMPKHSQ